MVKVYKEGQQINLAYLFSLRKRNLNSTIKGAFLRQE